MGKLTAATVKALKHPGGKPGPKGQVPPAVFPDGEGLFLQVSAGNTKSWLFRYTLRGRTREMGLGPWGDPSDGKVSLAEARNLAGDARRLLRDGIDPIEHRKAQRQANAIQHGRSFREAVDAYIAKFGGGWTLRTKKQITGMLTNHAIPHIGNLPVADIGKAEVRKVLDPIWYEKPETASRLRGHIEDVLDFAEENDWRTGANPASWRGKLERVLPAREKVAGVEHRAALAWHEMPSFMAAVRQRDSMAARAMEFTILTAARTGEVLEVRWPEIDMDRALWTVPKKRMKAGKEHRVPLSDAALALLRARLEERAEGDESGFVFPGEAKGKPLSQMSMLMLLRRMNPHSEEKPARWRDMDSGKPITTHGFRACFRIWAGESYRAPREVAEAALAHKLPDKVERAYARGDHLEERKPLMAAWARHCGGETAGAEVIPLRRA